MTAKTTTIGTVLTAHVQNYAFKENWKSTAGCLPTLF